MRVSMNEDDHSYRRTKMLLDAGSNIIVKVNGCVLKDCFAADEENGTAAAIIWQGIQQGVLLMSGKVEITISLRD